MSIPPTRDIEETHVPPVSTLRSKFEQLSVDASAAKGGSRPSSVGHHDLLSAEPTSPRPRASSASNEPKPSPRLLRAASSSSDLKVEHKRAPPPPPSRGSQVNTPTHSGSPSPLLRPVVPSVPSSPSATPTLLNLEAKSALLARKPPPPPPSSSSRGEIQEPITTSAGISALIHKFGNVTPSMPPSKSGFSSPRVVSHSSITLPSSSSNSSLLSVSSATTEAPRAPRHSFPPENHASVPPRIVLPNPAPSPFDDATAGHVPSPARPPPLPTRRNGTMQTPSPSVDHGRAPSVDSVSTNTSDSSSTSPPETTSPVEYVNSHVTPPARNPPPRPPPRNKNPGLSKQASLPTTSSPSPISGAPPPLPARKNTGLVNEESRRVPPPPRHHSIMDIDVPPSSAPPTVPVQTLAESSTVPTISPPLATTPSVLSERKTFGAHPPPPTRTIALGDKLPPARRQPSGSSSDEEEEEVKKVELLPDSSRASRRPPALNVHNYSESYIHVPPYTGVVVVTGSIVAVSSGHHLKIYDLTQSDSPIHDLDPRGMGMEAKTKDFKITSMEFRPAAREADRGCYLWVGTKDGHLFELDIHAGLVVGMKLAIHTHAVTHMCRYGNNMVTLDETGKALVFTPDTPGADPGLSATQPRVVRIADKQDFVKIIGGKLWTSARDPSGSNAGNTSRGPIIRVYDIFQPGSVGRSVLPTEHLGAVTSGTVLQSQPGQVFIGHEGGNVSVWSLDTDDGLPVCQEVIKVSTSDILCLEGVNDRLWAGGRKGNIAAYDVSHKPWVMTNNWQAHQKLPVLRLGVDTWSIEKFGRLQVYSAGRDERLRFWDGLLGIDWIDQELLKRETEFSSFRDLTVLLVSWNMDSARPDGLSGTPDNINFLHNALSSVDSAPDIISFGFQEVIDLESRKMAAKSVLLGGKSRTTDGAISQRVTTAYKKWYDRLILAVRLAMPPDTPYTVIHTENMVGLFSCIFVKDSTKVNLRDTALATIKRGMGGRYGNKGGIISRMVIDDSSICFINCHLAAGQHHVRQRNADVAAFLEEEIFPESRELGPYVNGGDGTLVLDHEIVFMSGDMNYRIDLRRDAVEADIRKGDFTRLIAQDQLLKEMKNNRAFRLRPFSEGPLTFAPTYKYDRRSDEYDSSEKRRVPAWCDRVLWRSREPSRVEQLHYRRYEANISDHRPISSAFRMTVKSIASERREPVKAEVTTLWGQKEVALLEAAYAFYSSQNMV